MFFDSLLGPSVSSVPGLENRLTARYGVGLSNRPGVVLGVIDNKRSQVNGDGDECSGIGFSSQDEEARQQCKGEVRLPAENARFAACRARHGNDRHWGVGADHRVDGPAVGLRTEQDGQGTEGQGEGGWCRWWRESRQGRGGHVVVHGARAHRRGRRGR